MTAKAKRSDLSTEQVLCTVGLFRMDALNFLVGIGYPAKVVLAAYRRDGDRGYLDFGVSEAYPWLTPAGVAVLKKAGLDD